MPAPSLTDIAASRPAAPPKAGAPTVTPATVTPASAGKVKVTDTNGKPIDPNKSLAPTGGSLGQKPDLKQARRVAADIVRTRLRAGQDLTLQEQAYLQRVMATPEARKDPELMRLTTTALTPRPHQHRGIGGLINNAVGDVVDTVTSLPSLVGLVGKNAGAALQAVNPAYAYGQAGRVIPLPGAGVARTVASFGGVLPSPTRVLGEDVNIVRGAAQDTYRRWAPVFTRNDWGGVYAHPLIAATDVAGAYSLAGKAATLGAKGAVAAGVGREGGALRAVADSHNAAGVLRARPDREFRAGQETADSTFPEGGPIQVGNVLREAQKPRSANPITAAFQRAVTDPAREALRRGVAGAADRVLGGHNVPGVHHFSTQGQYARAAVRDARRMNLQELDGLLREVEDLTAPHTNAVRAAAREAGKRPGAALRKDTPENIAINAHIRGMFNVDGMTPREARDALVAFYRDGIGKARRGEILKGHALRVKRSERAVDMLEALPDAYLSYDTLPPAMKRAVDTGNQALDVAEHMQKDVSGRIAPDAVDRRDKAQRKLDAGGDLTPEDVAALQETVRDNQAQIEEAARHSRELDAAQAYGGARFDKTRPLVTDKTRALRGQLGDLEEQVRAMSRKPETGEAFRALQRARADLTRALREQQRGRVAAADGLLAEVRANIDNLRATSGATLPGGRAAAEAVAPRARKAVRDQARGPRTPREVQRMRERTAAIFDRGPQGVLESLPYEVSRTTAGPEHALKQAEHFRALSRELEDRHVVAVRRKDGTVHRYNNDSPLVQAAREEMEAAKEEAAQRDAAYGTRADVGVSPNERALMDAQRFLEENPKGTPGYTAARAAYKEANRRVKADRMGQAAAAATGKNRGLEDSVHATMRNHDTGGEFQAGAVGTRDALKWRANDRTQINDPHAPGGRRAKNLGDYVAEQIEEVRRGTEAGYVHDDPAWRQVAEDIAAADRYDEHARLLEDAFGAQKAPEGADHWLSDEEAGGGPGITEPIDPDVAAFKEAVLQAIQEGLDKQNAGAIPSIGGPIGPVGGGEPITIQESAAPRKEAAGRRTFRAMERQNGQVGRELEALAHEANFQREVARRGLLTPKELRDAERTVKALEREWVGLKARDTVGDARDIVNVKGTVTWIKAKIKAEEKVGSWTPPAPVGIDLESVTGPGVTAAEQRLQKARQELASADPGGGQGYWTREVARRERELREARIEEARRQGHEFSAPDAHHIKRVPREKVKAKDRVMGTVAPGSTRNKLTELEREKRNEGVLHSYFNINTQPRAVTYTVLRALQAARHPEALARFLARHVLTDQDGKAISGNRAALVFSSNQEANVLVRVGGVRRALRRIDEINPDMPESTVIDQLRGLTKDETGVADAAGVIRDTGGDPFANTFFKGGDHGNSTNILDEAGNFLPGVNPDDFVLVPKAAAEEWQSISNARANGYDNVLGMWKRGVLAFMPRWYVYNLVGNSLQYGMMSGGDVRSLRLANRQATDSRARRLLLGRGEGVRDAVDPRVTGSTFAADTGGGNMDVMRRRITDGGIAFNEKMENLLKRAAYVNRAQKHIRQAGIATRRDLFRMSDGELRDLIDNMPDRLKEEALRESLHWMGDYQSFNKVERNILKRVFPFYSWMRVISRIVLTTPIKYPVRSAVLAALAVQATIEEAPGDFARPVYDRGRIGPLQTTGMNPAYTVAGPLAAFAEGGVTGLGKELSGSASPIVRPFLGLFGVNAVTGNSITAPPGYQGSFNSFGFDPRRISPITGGSTPDEPTVPWYELALQQVPIAGSLPRQLLAGQDKPYDTTTTWDLAKYRLGLGGDPASLLRAGRYDPVSRNLPYGLSAVSSSLGIPMKDRDPQAEIDMVLRQLAKDIAAASSTQRQIARQQARIGG